MSISVELSSEIAAAIVGRREFDDPVRRDQLIQAMFEAHLTLRICERSVKKVEPLERFMTIIR